MNGWRGGRRRIGAGNILEGEGDEEIKEEKSRKEQKRKKSEIKEEEIYTT